MKKEKAHWFIRNSSWFFWVALLPTVVMGNVLFSKVQLLIRFGYQTTHFLMFLIALILFVGFVMFLGFIIYLHDTRDGNIKRRLSWFDSWIQKWHLED
ncbi:MAG: hypothetical protein PHI40_02985 [Caldisericia bacterium]|nr:hypothetical protein [Caldisericia bacterium]MDD4614357.1 hypothetical protein [Caldisericia bacterium]